MKSRWPSVPVLALSMHDELLFAERVLRAGAIGYLNKSLAPSYLLEGIRRALRGELVISAAVTEMLLQRMNHKGRDERAASPTALLSDRELEILDLMGQGLGTREVASALHISAKTVETHQAHMKNKLGLHSGSGLMRLAVSWVENPDRS